MAQSFKVQNKKISGYAGEHESFRSLKSVWLANLDELEDFCQGPLAPVSLISDVFNAILQHCPLYMPAEKAHEDNRFPHIHSQPLMYFLLVSKLKMAKITAGFYEKFLISMLQKIRRKYILDDNTAFCTFFLLWKPEN